MTAKSVLESVGALLQFTYSSCHGGSRVDGVPETYQILLCDEGK